MTTERLFKTLLSSQQFTSGKILPFFTNKKNEFTWNYKYFDPFLPHFINILFYSPKFYFSFSLTNDINYLKKKLFSTGYYII